MHLHEHLDVFGEGLLPTAELISHRLRLPEYERAIELLGRPDTGKVLLVPPMDRERG